MTGAAITNFSAHAHTRSGQTTSDELILTDVQIGTHQVMVSAPGYLANAVVTVAVVEGQQAQATVTLTPEARIEVIVTLASTGAPLPDMCVIAFSPSGFGTVLNGQTAKVAHPSTV